MKIYKICFTARKILLYAFVFSIIRDYIQYDTTLNSAPFYMFILVNAMITLLPAGIMFLIGKWLEKREV